MSNMAYGIMGATSENAIAVVDWLNALPGVVLKLYTPSNWMNPVFLLDKEAGQPVNLIISQGGLVYWTDPVCVSDLRTACNQCPSSIIIDMASGGGMAGVTYVPYDDPDAFAEFTSLCSG